MTKLNKLIAVLAQLAFVGTVQAASISLTPTSTTGSVGSQVNFQVNLNFDVATGGGSFRVLYDPALLGNANFSYASLGYPITEGWAPIYGSVAIDSVGFSADGFQGTATLGTLSFTVLGTGSTSIGLADATNSRQRFLVLNQWDPIPVNYSGASLTLTPAAVPVPGALWLMATGLGALGAAVRRRAA